jgi:uncharacterized protein
MNQKQIIAQELHSTQSALSNIDFKSGQTFKGQGEFPLESFPRLLLEMPLAQRQNSYKVEWECLSWIDVLPTGQEQYRLKIKALTTIPLTCQRCLDDSLQNIEVNSQFVLLNTQAEVDDFPLENDDEDALLNAYEFNLFELIEDELLLALPLVPKHADQHCQKYLINISEPSEAQLDEVEDLIDPKTGKLNPFLQLKKLKLN